MEIPMNGRRKVLEMTIEERLQELILSRYPTIKAFAEDCGIKYSTMLAVFQRGLDNTGATNLIAICRTLGITLDGLARDEIEFSTADPSLVSFRSEQNRFFNLMLDGKVEIDGVVLSDEELRLVDDMISAAADIVRRRRDRKRPKVQEDFEE